MKKVISGAVAAMMVGTVSVPVMAKDFPDSTGHWAQEAISVWSDRGVVNGDDQGNFRPGDSITRAETATVLDNMIGYEKQSVKVFSDVKKEDWFAQAISRLYEAKVITGYEDGTIRPANSITRQEAVVMICRALGVEAGGADHSVLDQFSDNAEVQDWAKDAVAWMAGEGFVQGSDGMFRPASPITRAEIVTILNNMIAIYATDKGGTVTGSYGNRFAVVKEPTTFNSAVMGGVVVSPKVSGKVNFNSGTKITGKLYNLSSEASLNTAGAQIADTESPNGVASSGNSYSSGSSGGGSYSGGNGGGFGGGGSSSSSSNKTTYRVTFNANSGTFGGLDSSYSYNYTRGTAYRANAPSNPTRDGYTFDGWYTTQEGANELDETKKVNMSSLVSGNVMLYAGWEKVESKYGYVLPATGTVSQKDGITAKDMMTNVQIDTAKNKGEFTMTGTLNYIHGYSESGMLGITEGNFLALTYKLPKSIRRPEDVIVTSYIGNEKNLEEYKNFIDTDDEENSGLAFTRVFYITENDLDKEIVYEVDLEGEGVEKDIYEIVIDISKLKLGENKVKSEEVTTEAAFKEALASDTLNQIVVAESFALVDGTTYKVTNGDKTIVVEKPMILAKDSYIELSGLKLQPAKNVGLATLLVNATEEIAPVEEGAESTTVSTQAAQVKLSGNTVTGKFTDGLITNLNAKTMIIVDNVFVGDGTGLALSLPADAENGIRLTGNTFDQYATALEYSLSINEMSKNLFLNNTLDVKLPAEIPVGTIPSLAYNFFEGDPMVEGTAILSPLYTDRTCEENDLEENTDTDDAYFIYGETQKVLSEVTEITDAEAESMAIKVIPMDVRDTVKIGEDTVDTFTVTATGEVKITVGTKEYTVTVTLKETTTEPEPGTGGEGGAETNPGEDTGTEPGTGTENNSGSGDAGGSEPETQG